MSPIARSSHPSSDSVHSDARPRQSNELFDLSVRFYSVMPRELRDMVYAHLLAPLNETWKILTDGTIVSKPDATKPLRRPRIIQYLSDGLVCPPIIEEMAEVFYAQNTFELEHDCSGLEPFLNTGGLSLSTDFAPRNHVRHIRIILPAIIAPADRCLSHQVGEQLHLNLRILLTINRPSHCQLEFVLDQDHLICAASTLMDLVSFVYEARGKGFSSRVCLKMGGFVGKQGVVDVSEMFAEERKREWPDFVQDPDSGQVSEYSSFLRTRRRRRFADE